MTRQDVLQRVKEKLPYVGGRSVEAVLAMVRELLSDQTTQRITLDRSWDHLLLHRTPRPEEQSIKSTLEEMLRRVPMEEYIAEENRGPYEQLFDMFRMVEDEKLQVAFIAVGEHAELHRWLKVPRRTTSLFGVAVQRFSQLPKTTIVLCGAEHRDAEPDEILFAVKGELP